MGQKIFAVMALAAVAACSGGNGTNPITGGGGNGGGGGGTTKSIYGGEVSSVTVDQAAGTMVVDNIPFDGQTYTRNNTVTVLTGFDLYENTLTSAPGSSKYFAVVGTTASGALQVVAIGTGDYLNEGFGGYAILRDSSTVNLPATGQAVYTGDYAGVRTIYPSSGGTNDVQLTSGDATLRVDFGDFNVGGAIEGTIQNRTYYDTNGALLGTLPTIVLGTSSIGDDATFTGGSATTFDDTGIAIDTGTYEGLFAGTNGAEIGGVIILDGVYDANLGLSASERGVFTATN